MTSKNLAYRHAGRNQAAECIRRNPYLAAQHTATVAMLRMEWEARLRREWEAGQEQAWKDHLAMHEADFDAWLEWPVI